MNTTHQPESKQIDWPLIGFFVLAYAIAWGALGILAVDRAAVGYRQRAGAAGDGRDLAVWRRYFERAGLGSLFVDAAGGFCFLYFRRGGDRHNGRQSRSEHHD